MDAPDPGTVTSTDGTRLAVTSTGQPGAPPVVLVHGLGLSADSWAEVAARLAPAHRVVAYDLRGHGSSGRGAGSDYSMGAHARDLEAVLQAQLTEGERAVLVGSSLGGGIIFEHAHASGTTRTAGVVLAGSGATQVTVPGLADGRLPEAVRRRLRRGYLELLRGVAVAAHTVRPLTPLADRLTRMFGFTPDTPHEPVAQVRESFMRTPREPLARTTLASVSHDGLEIAPDLPVPVLVVHGTRDPEVPQDEVQRLVRTLPDTEVITVDGGGHMLPMTHPQLVADAIAGWVTRTHAGRR